MSTRSAPLNVARRAVAVNPAPRRPWRARLEPFQALLYLLPAVVMIGVWLYKPLVETFLLATYQWNLLPTTPKVFVAMENFERLLSLPEMRRATVNTLVYIFGTLPFSVLIPLAVALLTDQLHTRWRNLYRTLIFVPMIMAPVVVSVIWRWLLHPTNGVVNVGLQNAFGLDPISFFRDTRLAIWTIIFITGWKLLGFSTLIFAAAIANVDRSYLEAAQLDGARRGQIVRFVILPIISPTVLFMGMLSVLLSAQWSFAYINVLTQGGPRQATTNLYHLLWVYGFGTFAVGWSAAAAVLLFVAFGLVAWLCLTLIRRYSFYDS